MGQRLVINIMDKEKTLANAYYHWSGYSDSAVELTLGVLDFLNSTIEEDKVLKSIYALEDTGAGLTNNHEGYNFAQIEYPKNKFKKGENRNDGLIEITEEGMKNNEYWSEGSVYIDINTLTTNFQVCFYYDSIESIYDSFGEEYTEEINNDFKNIPEVDFEFHNMLIEDVEWLYNLLITTDEIGVKHNDGGITTFIR